MSETKTICPLVFTFTELWSKELSPEDLKRWVEPFNPQIQNSYSASAQTLRACLVVDWLVREIAPQWLDAVGLGEYATRLKGLKELNISISTIMPAEELLNIILTKIGAQSEVRVKQEAQKLAGSLGVTAAMGSAINFKSPAMTQVAFHASIVIMNCVATKISMGSYSKGLSLDTLVTLTRQSASDLVWRMLKT